VKQHRFCSVLHITLITEGKWYWKISNYMHGTCISKRSERGVFWMTSFSYYHAQNLLSKIMFSPSMPLKHIVGAEVQLHSFLILALHGDEWLTSQPGCPRGKDNSTHWPAGWAGPRGGSGCFGEKNLLPLVEIELQTIQPIVQLPNVRITEE
jgi:hypothetical protein